MWLEADTSSAIRGAMASQSAFAELADYASDADSASEELRAARVAIAEQVGRPLRAERRPKMADNLGKSDF